MMADIKMRKIIAIFLLSSTAHAQADILNILGGIGTAVLSQKEKQKTEQLQLKQEADWKAEKDRRIAEKQAEQVRIEAEELEAEKKREDRAEDLKKGRVSPETIDDLEVLYDYPDDGWNLAAGPKLAADKEIYIASGVIEKQTNGLLLCRTVPSGEKTIGDYFAVRPNNKTKKNAYLKDARINGRIYVVGRYARNLEYNTVGAGQKIMPVLDAIHIILPYD